VAIGFEFVEELPDFAGFVYFDAICLIGVFLPGEVLAFEVDADWSIEEVAGTLVRIPGGCEGTGLGLVFYQFADNLQFHN
jgi:hypothetical protein